MKDAKVYIVYYLQNFSYNILGYLIGNKNDVNQDRQVITDKEANKLATELGLKYFKVPNG